MCELILTGFSDEAANSKTVDQQFSAFAAMGLSYLSLRFIDVGEGIKNVMDLTDGELAIVESKLNEYGLRVSSIGSPIGKTKLLNVDDGTNNTYFEFSEYLEQHVEKACRIAEQLDCKLIRGFSFYHPKGSSPAEHLDLAANQLREIAHRCDSHQLTFGLEVEANLIGHNAELLVQLHDRVDSEALVLIFDGANLVTQGYTEKEVLDQFNQMKPALGWIHVKDHLASNAKSRPDYVDEESLCDFVPAGAGAGAYPDVLRQLKDNYPDLMARLKRRGLPGIFADLEPHLKGGGQFGGFSGPDGFGIATRAFCELCDQTGINYRLRDYDSIS